jgi:hypothetical protein
VAKAIRIYEGLLLVRNTGFGQYQEPKFLGVFKKRRAIQTQFFLM